MDYDRIINLTYNWISLKKVFWFLIFFWLAMPILFVVPWALEKQFFDESFSWIVYILYAIIYFGIIVGFVSLTCACLGQKKLKYQNPTKSKFFDTFLLVLLELWYIFIWNIHKSHRFTQLLLLIGTPLLYFYYLFNPTELILGALILFTILYLVTLIHNSVRLFFTVTIFYNKNLSKREAIKECWELTHKKFVVTFFSILLVVGVVFVMFAVIAIILEAVAYLLLIPAFNPAVAYSLAQTIAVLFALGPATISYYFGVIEIYSQLEKERDSSSRIKRLLARKILSPKKHLKEENQKVKKRKVKKNKGIKKVVKKIKKNKKVSKKNKVIKKKVKKKK